MSVVLATGEGMAQNLCVKRSLETAFRYAGVSFPIPDDIRYTDNLRQYCKDLGLEVYTESVVVADDRPILAVYKTDHQDTPENEGGFTYHAVFCSDCGCIYQREIHTVVLGWENFWENLCKSKRATRLEKSGKENSNFEELPFVKRLFRDAGETFMDLPMLKKVLSYPKRNLIK